MIEKNEYEKFGTMLFRALGILMIFMGVSFAVVTIFWDIFLSNPHTEYNEILGRLNAVSSVLSAALIFSGIIIGFVSSYFGKKICSKL